MNDNETKAVKLCIASVLFMMGIWIFLVSNIIALVTNIKHCPNTTPYQNIAGYKKETYASFLCSIIN